MLFWKKLALFVGDALEGPIGREKRWPQILGDGRFRGLEVVLHDARAVYHYVSGNDGLKGFGFDVVVAREIAAI